MPDVVIVSACRTVIGTARKGTLDDSDSYDLVRHVVGEAITRASIDASLVGDVGADWSEFELVANPRQFDETPPALLRAPETGEHTKQVLLELGLTWEELADLKGKEVII